MTPGAGNGTTRPRHCVGRCTRWCRQIYDIAAVIRATLVSPLRCGVFVHGIAAVIRATQVSPLRRGMFGRDIAADRRGGPVVPAALRRDNARRGAIYDARSRKRHDPFVALRWAVYAVVPANCDIAADRPGDTSVAPTLRGVRPRNCGGHPGDTSVAPTARGVRPRYCGGHPGDTSVAPTLRGVRPRNRGGHPGDTSVAPTLRDVRPRNRGCHPGDTSVAPTLRDVRPRHCGRPWLSTVDDFYDGDGLDKLTFRYVTVRSNLDGAFSIRYVDVLTVIIRGRFIGQQKYNCPDRRHDHS